MFFETVIPVTYRTDLSVRVEVPVDKLNSTKGQCYEPTVALIEAKQDIIHLVRRKVGLFDTSVTDKLDFSKVDDASLDVRISFEQPYAPTYRRMLEHLQFLAFNQDDINDVAKKVFYTEELLTKLIGADGVPSDNYKQIIEETNLDDFHYEVLPYVEPEYVPPLESFVNRTEEADTEMHKSLDEEDDADM